MRLKTILFGCMRGRLVFLVWVAYAWVAIWITITPVSIIPSHHLMINFCDDTDAWSLYGTRLVVIAGVAAFVKYVLLSRHLLNARAKTPLILSILVVGFLEVLSLYGSSVAIQVRHLNDFYASHTEFLMPSMLVGIATTIGANIFLFCNRFTFSRYELSAIVLTFGLIVGLLGTSSNHFAWKTNWKDCTPEKFYEQYKWPRR